MANSRYDWDKKYKAKFKRLVVDLSPEDEKNLEKVKEHYGMNQSALIKFLISSEQKKISMERNFYVESFFVIDSANGDILDIFGVDDSGDSILVNSQRAIVRALEREMKYRSEGGDIQNRYEVAVNVYSAGEHKTIGYFYEGILHHNNLWREETLAKEKMKNEEVHDKE